MMRRSPVHPFRLAVVACLLAAARCRADDAACRDGAHGPHCPVRPTQFGYYPTQWRRWPASAPEPAGRADPATPAPPARSLVPRPDEESPVPRDAATPEAARSPTSRGAVVPTEEAARSLADRLARLAEEADAARFADAAARGRFGDRLVAAMLSEHDPRARCAVLDMASGFDVPGAEAVCVGALEDPDPRVRAAACDACVERRGDAAVDSLARRAREDVDLGVRLRAIRCLGDLGDPAGIAALTALLDDPDEAVRSRAAAALTRAKGRDVGPEAASGRRWIAAPTATPGWSFGAAIRRLF